MIRRSIASLTELAQCKSVLHIWVVMSAVASAFFLTLFLASCLVLIQASQVSRSVASELTRMEATIAAVGRDFYQTGRVLYQWHRELQARVVEIASELTSESESTSLQLLILATGVSTLSTLILLAVTNGAFRRDPGQILLAIAEFLYSKRSYSSVLEPTIRDLQEEHYEALCAGRLWKARYALMRGYWSFWSAGLAEFSGAVLRKLLKALGLGMSNT